MAPPPDAERLIERSVRHVYAFSDGLIISMEIRRADALG
jgi:hypothetical protein